MLVTALPAAVVADGGAKDAGKEKPKSRISSEITTTLNNTMTPEEMRNASVAAGRILKHAQQAREAVAAKNSKQALENIDKALTLVGIIETVQPSYKVTAKITAGDLTYSDSDVVKVAEVPLYQELDDLTMYYPVLKASHFADAAKACPKVRHEKSMDKKSAGKDSVHHQGKDVPAVKSDKKPNSKPNENAKVKAKDDWFTLAANSGVNYTSVSMDVALAKDGLNAAKQALSNEKSPNYEEANLALFAVLDSVVYDYTEVDLPLQQARTNLGLAKSLFEAGDSEGAQSALKVASDALEIYGSGVAEHRSKEVKTLKTEIDSFIANVDKATGDEGVKKASGWWDQVRGWFK